MYTHTHTVNSARLSDWHCVSLYLQPSSHSVFYRSIAPPAPSSAPRTLPCFFTDKPFNCFHSRISFFRGLVPTPPPICCQHLADVVTQRSLAALVLTFPLLGENRNMSGKSARSMIYINSSGGIFWSGKESCQISSKAVWTKISDSVHKKMTGTSRLAHTVGICCVHTSKSTTLVLPLRDKQGFD